MRRLAVLLALLGILLSFGCRREQAPERAVHEFVKRAQKGDFDGAMEYLTQDSVRRFSMVWALSNRYGYVKEETLRFLQDLTVDSVAIKDGVAKVTVHSPENTGELWLVLEEDRWRIDLMRSTSTLRPQPLYVETSLEGEVE